MKVAVKCLNLIAFLAMVIINALANILPIGGNTTGEVSGLSPTLFTPAPITFSIWGIIYLFMGFFAVYQLLLSREKPAFDRIMSDVGPWFILSCIMNIAWIFSWHNQKIGLSLIFMIGLLFTLIFINMSYTIRHDIDPLERICVYGFNIYIGWICAATIANISVFLSRIRWTRFGLTEQFWTLVVIVIGALIGITFTLNGHRFMATLAIAWAYCGILIRHISPSGYGKAYPLIIIITICCALAMLVSIFIAWIVPEILIYPSAGKSHH